MLKMQDAALQTYKQDTCNKQTTICNSEQKTFFVKITFVEGGPISEANNISGHVRFE